MLCTMCCAAAVAWLCLGATAPLPHSACLYHSTDCCHHVTTTITCLPPAIPHPLADTAGENVVLLVNNLGSTTPLEMNEAARVAAQHVHTQLHAKLERLYCGRYMTSLDMHGLSVTLMRLDDRMLQLLDAPTQAGRLPIAQLAASCREPLPFLARPMAVLHK